MSNVNPKHKIILLSIESIAKLSDYCYTTIEAGMLLCHLEVDNPAQKAAAQDHVSW